MLTLKERQIYQFIRQYILAHDYAPTVAEIANGVNVQSRGVIYRYLKALVEKDCIEMLPGQRRNIRLIVQDDDGSSTGSLPMLGKIAAGEPIEAVEHDQRFDITHTLIGPNRFILQVKGDSMIGDNICDGDYIICEKRSSVYPHEIAIVLIDNQEATLKRVQKNKNNTVTLLPSNANLSPMVYPAGQVIIQGIFIGLLRIHC